MIDLHLHTTASDGRLAPRDLVIRAHGAGLRTISVTDHDTVAAFGDVVSEAGRLGVGAVPGIEITAVHDGRDVHVLGYFFDPADEELARFLETQRAMRIERVHQIGRKLESLGVPVAIDRLFEAAAAEPGRSIGRPAVARAMISAGHVGSVDEAFDRFLAAGRPAFVPRTGVSPREVVDVIHAAGGIASLAHPGVTNQPAIIEPLIAHGLDALEAYHSDHTPAVQADILAIAARFGIAVSGGSDFHGDDHHRRIGEVTLPPDAFERLSASARRSRAANG